MDLVTARRWKRELVRQRGGDRRRGPLLSWSGAGPRPSPLALGLEPDGAGGHRLAVRVVRTLPGLAAVLERLESAVGGEIGVRFVGWVLPQDDTGPAGAASAGASPPAAAAGLRRRVRPLVAGCSLGALGGGAGTLGAVVVPRGGGRRGLLSSAHALGWVRGGVRYGGSHGEGAELQEGREARRRAGVPARRGTSGGSPACGRPAAAGCAVLQPAAGDGGRAPADRVARLAASVLPDPRCRNRLDAALAELADGVAARGGELPGLGRLAGVRWAPLAGGETVYKVGRTTGVTRGRVSAFEVDDLAVSSRRGDLVFDGCFEIEPFGEGSAADRPFSLPGDSGALVVDEARRAVGLLFAGNGVDVAYAQPIGEVLERLRVGLAV